MKANARRWSNWYLDSPLTMLFSLSSKIYTGPTKITLDYLAWLANAVADCPALMVFTSRAEGDPIDTNWRARAGEAPIVTWDLRDHCATTNPQSWCRFFSMPMNPSRNAA